MRGMRQMSHCRYRVTRLLQYQLEPRARLWSIPHVTSSSPPHPSVHACRYADHTGLMWENAAAFGAFIVFAEHRYYGLSQPFGSAEASLQYPQYLTHEQAQADYAALAFYLTNTLLPSLAGGGAGPVNQPIILFGGSYGGMLAAWTRAKYPGTFHGAVSASAPIRLFQGMQPAIDPQRYWQVVTRDATPAAGSTPDCAQKVTSAFAALWSNANTAPGLARLSSTFGLCTPLATPADVNALAFFLMGSWDTMAMGNFPYPSNYLTGGGGNPNMPAWPVRAACSVMSQANAADPWSLLAGLNAATGVFNNVTGTVECYNPPAGDGIWEDAVWDIQWCSELLPEETYFPRNGAYPAPGGDMFWGWNFTNDDITQHCMNSFGYTPRFTWIAQEYGMLGLGASNIVFSNGEYDPWSSGGVNVSTPALPSVWIAEGAHHLDLFFSNPQDPASVTNARATEMGYVKQWVTEYYAAQGGA